MSADPAPGSQKRSVLVLYASETGNAQDVAEELGDLACVLTACPAKACKPGHDVRCERPSVDILHTYTCFDVAYPRASVRARMGRAMVSFATLMNLRTAVKKGRETHVKVTAPVDDLVHSHLLLLADAGIDLANELLKCRTRGFNI